MKYTKISSMDSHGQRMRRNLFFPMVKGLTILGGEPFQNVEGLLPVLQKIKQESPKTIWIYSGYTFEQLCSDVDKKELLGLCDVLVDGPFVRSLRDVGLRFRGSSNQRLIDVQTSLARGKVALWQG